jgi:hypothetical protein
MGKKPVKNLRRFLNIVKIEANNRNRYSKNWFRMGMEGYEPAKLINLPKRWFPLPREQAKFKLQVDLQAIINLAIKD